MVDDGELSLQCVVFDADRWYEVDSMSDLAGAERISQQKWMPSTPVLPMRVDSPKTLACPDFDGGEKLDFAAIIVRGGRDGTKGLPAGVPATSSGSG